MKATHTQNYEKTRTGAAYASVNSSSAHAPPHTHTHTHTHWQPRGIQLTLSVPGVGHLKFYRGPGAGDLCTISNYQNGTPKVARKAFNIGVV